VHKAGNSTAHISAAQKQRPLIPRRYAPK